MENLPEIDVIVVGSGIAGLAAVDRWLEESETCSIVVLEKADRIGGASVTHTHKFQGKLFEAPGGGQSITRPRSFSSQTRMFLESVGIDLSEFEQKYLPDHFDSFGCKTLGFSFLRSEFRQAKVIKPGVSVRGSCFPMNPKASEQLSSLFNHQPDWLACFSEDKKIEILRQHTCESLLREYSFLDDEVYLFLRRITAVQSGMNFNQHPALDGVLMRYFPLAGIQISESRPAWEGLSSVGVQFYPNEDPPIYRLPGGNGWLVSSLIEKWKRQGVNVEVESSPATGTMKAGKNVTFLLNCELVSVSELDSLQIRGRVTKSRGKSLSLHASTENLIFCGYANEIQNIFHDLVLPRGSETGYLERYPLVSASVLFRTIEPWAECGVRDLFFVGESAWQVCSLPIPTKAFGNDLPSSISDPVVATALGCFTETSLGDPIQAARLGREKLASISVELLEDDLRGRLLESLSPFGLRSEDLISVQIEKWVQGGYAIYMTEPRFKESKKQVNDLMSKIFNHSKKIAFAGVDFADSPFLDAAIDTAFSAVRKLKRGRF